jgi:mono/diheme cytochrome c family protein
MRHFLANVATYTIAVLLLAGAGTFAWVRSAKLVITTEDAVLAAYVPDEGAPFEWESLGARSYVRNCLNCHGAQGGGWDQYPGLENTGRMAGEPGGLVYLVDLHIYGADSPRWRAPMPPMGHLHDVEMAAVINYVLTRFGGVDAAAGGTLLTPMDVATRRGQRLSPRAVEERRPH